MPCVIRKIIEDGFENHAELLGDEWKLREQVEALEAWLCQNPKQLDPQFQWVADIGFQVQENAAGGGPSITRQLMRLCLESNLEIYLSEYPGTT